MQTSFQELYSEKYRSALSSLRKSDLFSLHNLNNLMNLVSFLEIRFVSASFLMLLFSLKRYRNPIVNVLLASAVLLLAYGINNLIILFSLFSLNIILIYTASHFMNEYSFIIMNLSLLYCYKFFGRIIEPRITSTFDISGCIMILTIKMTHLRRDIRMQKEDGEIAKTENSNEKGVNKDKEHANKEKKCGGIKKTLNPLFYRRVFFGGESFKNTKLPNIADFLRYLFFIPSLLSGPAPSFSDFIRVDTTAKTGFPFLHFLLTVFCMLSYGAFKSLPFIPYIQNSKSPFVAKLLALYSYNLISRMKFHFIWNLAHCCFLLNNIDNLLNIDFYKVEFTESVREISSNWNRFVSRWVKDFFFIQLKEHSIKSAVLVSHMASAILHGVNTCYLLFTLSFGVFSPVITRVNSCVPSKIFQKIQMLFFVSYFSMPFYLLDINELYKVWGAVYFYGHVYCVSFMVFFRIVDIIKRKKVQKAEDSKAERPVENVLENKSKAKIAKIKNAIRCK